MTRLFERLVIAGVGLIGGSLALAARAAGLVGEIVGLGRTQENLDVALARGIIDWGTRDPRQAAHAADAVILAVPVAAMAPLVREMASVLPPGAIISDAGSVKARVVEEIELVTPAHARFVGAHPIAGTEDSGAAAAKIDLYQGARCILTPTPRTDRRALAVMRALWEGVGAVVEEMSPQRHDETLAWVSHVPHMLAFSLMRACPEDMRRFAGSSFRDATRVAASPVEMWRDISLYNAEAIDRCLEAFIRDLSALRQAIRDEDAGELTRILGEARAARRRPTGGGA